MVQLGVKCQRTFIRCRKSVHNTNQSCEGRPFCPAVRACACEKTIRHTPSLNDRSLTQTNRSPGPVRRVLNTSRRAREWGVRDCDKGSCALRYDFDRRGYSVRARNAETARATTSACGLKLPPPSHTIASKTRLSLWALFTVIIPVKLDKLDEKIPRELKIGTIVCYDP